MAGKFEIVEVIKNARQELGIDKPGAIWHCLDVVVKGSENAPKGLPLPSREIQYTILINDKQKNKLEKELKDLNIEELVGARIRVVGEITLDLPLGVCEGEIGIIAYQIQIVEKPAKKEPEKPQKRFWPIHQIVIPLTFRNSQPREQKIDAASSYLAQHGVTEKPVVTIPLENGQQLLQDGYVHYLVAKANGAKEVWIQEQNKLQPKQDADQLLWPMQQLEIPEKFLITEPREAKIKATIEQLNKGGQIEKPLETIRLWNGLRALTDGYIRYLALHRCKHEYAWIETPAEDEAVYVSVNDVRIPEGFLKSQPRKEKIDAAASYLAQHGFTEKPIVIEVNEQDEIWLKDGYTRYLALKEKNEQFAWAEID